MRYRALALRDFRCYRTLDLPLEAGLLFFWGPNGSGKTSLLEAVYLLATTRSPRAQRDRELVRIGAEGELGFPPAARIVGEGVGRGREVRLELVLLLRNREGTEKRVRVDGRRRPLRELVGRIPAVFFRPEDLHLFAAPPELRRRALNLFLGQLDRRYLHALQEYDRILRQRNALLRQGRQGRPPTPRELEPWTAALARMGGRIQAARARWLARLAPHLEAGYRRFSGQELPLEVRYRPAGVGEPRMDEGEAIQALARAFERLQEAERRLGYSLAGPHRDDLRFFLGEKDLGLYGSRGERRTLALAWRLAEARLLTEGLGEPPVLLLDDLLSELDPERRERVAAELQAVPDVQVFLTGTDLEVLPPSLRRQVRIYRVTAGRVEG